MATDSQLDETHKGIIENLIGSADVSTELMRSGGSESEITNQMLLMAGQQCNLLAGIYGELVAARLRATGRPSPEGSPEIPLPTSPVATANRSS